MNINHFTGAITGLINIFNAKLSGYTEAVATPTITNGVLTLDIATVSVFNVAHTEGITSIVIANPPASGTSASFTLNLTQDATGGRSLAYASGTFKPAIGVTISINTTANTRNVLVFNTTNGGATYDIQHIGAW